MAATLFGALLLGVAIPVVFMRMLARSLQQRHPSAVKNYRGREVSSGLGIVWLVWAGCAIVGGAGAAILSPGSALRLLMLAGPLALVAFALGLVDDAYGSADAKGFRGHLSAMARGRLTTGGLKLVGIGLACLSVATLLVEVAPWGARSFAGIGELPLRLVAILVAGAAIALTSNFVNLTDLRPGRALKVYGLLAVIGVFLVAALGVSRAGLPVALQQWAVDAVALLAFVLGPVFAVWRYDLGELGMLGDAGANPMGAVAGLVIVAGLPTWGLFAYAGLMLALNVASERVSYSRIIDATPVLHWLDGLGRLPDSPMAQDSMKDTHHPGAIPK